MREIPDDFQLILSTKFLSGRNFVASIVENVRNDIQSACDMCA